MIMRKAVPNKKAGEPDAGRELTPWLVLLFVPVVLMLLLHLRGIVIMISLAGDIRSALFHDQCWRWAECRWLMRGVNPMDVVRGHLHPAESVMALPKIAGAFPWAYLLGILLTFAFLPYPAAAVLSVLCILAATAAFSVLIYRFLYQYSKNRPFAWFGVFFFLSSSTLTGTLYYGNYGFLCGFLIIASVLTAAEHPWLSGAFLMLASVKPQITLLFFLALFLERKWKPVIIGGAGVLVSWGLTSFLCKVSPLTMLRETFVQSTSYSDR